MVLPLLSGIAFYSLIGSRGSGSRITVDRRAPARHSGHMVRFSFAGHDLVALREGALFWPARGALLVADLHLEKASWFARGGQMLPPYDSIATLADLTALVERTAPAEIWCLGDSFHASAGSARLPERARAMLGTLTTRRRWVWRSEARRAAKECVSTCRSRWSPSQ